MSSFAVSGIQLPAVGLRFAAKADARQRWSVVTRAGVGGEGIGENNKQTRGSKKVEDVGRRATLLSVGVLLGRGAGVLEAWADDGNDGDFKKDYSNYNSGVAAGGDEGQSELVKRLLAKSAENKEKNDAERYNYDKQYAANLAIIKGSGYVPDDQASRDKLGITRPPECDLPYFKASPLCAKF